MVKFVGKVPEQYLVQVAGGSAVVLATLYIISFIFWHSSFPSKTKRSKKEDVIFALENQTKHLTISIRSLLLLLLATTFFFPNQDEIIVKCLEAETFHTIRRR